MSVVSTGPWKGRLLSSSSSCLSLLTLSPSSAFFSLLFYNLKSPQIAHLAQPGTLVRDDSKYLYNLGSEAQWAPLYPTAPFSSGRIPIYARDRILTRLLVKVHHFIPCQVFRSSLNSNLDSKGCCFIHHLKKKKKCFTYAIELTLVFKSLERIILILSDYHPIYLSLLHSWQGRAVLLTSCTYTCLDTGHRFIPKSD